MSEPLIPSSALMSEYLGKWEQQENYRLQEASLGLLFHTFVLNNFLTWQLTRMLRDKAAQRRLALR
jgi:hypothetical protein